MTSSGTSNVENTNGSKTGKRIPVRLLVFILCVTALVPIALIGWSDLYSGFLEHNPPEISVLQFPRGVGLTPVTIKIKLTDTGAGLDEVVVRTIQKANAKEILRQSLGGQQSAEISVEFPGEKSSLEEGVAEFEVKAFDRSFWNNKVTQSFQLKIDYRRPKVEVLSSQHNARQGGSQLIIYRATDESLALSGVKVGGNTFLGYPARGLDKDLDDKSLFVAVYAAAAGQDPEKTPVRVFAEDEVGNAISATFYNKIHPRSGRLLTVPTNDDFLLNYVGELSDKNFDAMAETAKQFGEKFDFDKRKGGKDRLLEKFSLANQHLRRVDENQIISLIKAPRFERQWISPFLRPQGSVQISFMDQLRFTFEGKDIGQATSNGFELAVSRDDNEVLAGNDGIVIFAENIGTYGNVVALDHGLGVTSLYGHLESFSVRRGDTVKAGQKIGFAGRSGFSRNLNVFLQMRVHGIPVDPVEWWDKNWFYAHVNGKIDDVKQALGIPILRRIE